MIESFFYQKATGTYSGFELKGHALKPQTGGSLVCASVTTLTQACVVGLKDVLGLQLEIVKADDGYLRCTLPAGLKQDMQEKADLLLEVFRRGLLYLSTYQGERPQITVDTKLIP